MITRVGLLVRAMKSTRASPSSRFGRDPTDARTMNSRRSRAATATAETPVQRRTSGEYRAIVTSTLIGVLSWQDLGCGGPVHPIVEIRFAE
jgi:hypothetical protein